MILLRIKELAEKVCTNKTQLQKRTGLDMGQVRRYWENGTTSVDLRALEKLLTYFTEQGLDVTVGDLFSVTKDAP